MRRGGRMERIVRNVVRRMVVTTADVARWSLRGHGDGSAFEELEADVFPGIGFCARPPDDSETEAVAVAIEGSANRTIVVAARDSGTQMRIIDKAGLSANESMMHNADLVVKITANRQVLIGMPDGQFREVALADHKHELPGLVLDPNTGKPLYTSAMDPLARTGKPDSVSEHVKVT